MEQKIAHLEMIQGVITRMAGNSFLITGWSVTLVSALFALGAAGTRPVFVYLAYFPAFTFWALDAYYLRQERLFRRLYDHVRVLPEDSIDFSMDTTPFVEQVDSIAAVAFSRTLALFHGTIIVSIVIVMIGIIITE